MITDWCKSISLKMDDNDDVNTKNLWHHFIRIINKLYMSHFISNNNKLKCFITWDGFKCTIQQYRINHSIGSPQLYPDSFKRGQPITVK